MPTVADDRQPDSVSSAQELQRLIDEFPVWHYRFEFDGGVSTPIYRPDYANRHVQRRRMFFGPLVEACGGSLSGRRVLDLGSNAGYWALCALEAGADFVLGVDGRQMHIDQAQLVFDAKGVDPASYRFELGNIFEHELHEQFDIVLCLGLMYHIAKPVEIFEVMAGTGADLLLIDTTVSLAPWSLFRVAHEESLENPRNAVDYELLLIPTRQAIFDLARQFGYRSVALAHDITDYTGMADYRARERAAFICSKSTPLDALARENSDPLTLMRAYAGKRVRREWKRARRLLGRSAVLGRASQFTTIALSANASRVNGPSPVTEKIS
jgi:2-polyprenyl-3-methyl-5-hydroxy-6-metoxy-1,4-benzoquinol methylase